jgi:hypothetical protein
MDHESGVSPPGLRWAPAVPTEIGQNLSGTGSAPGSRHPGPAVAGAVDRHAAGCRKPPGLRRQAGGPGH